MSLASMSSVLVFGDSISKGVVMDSASNRYMFYKDRFLERVKARIRPEVHDYSKFGATTGYGRSLLTDKLSLHGPAIVFIEYGNNDCDYKWEEVIARPMDAHLPNIPVTEYEDNLHAMIAAVREAGGIPVFTNLHPLCANSYLNWFTKNDADRRRSVLKWLGGVENIYWWHEMYSYTVEKAARLAGAHVVNIRGAFLRRPNYKEYVCPDGIHLTEEGQSLIEQVLMGEIEKFAPELLLQA